MKPPTDILTIHERDRAQALLAPLRLELVELAATPISASEAATRLGLPRQRVNYHVRELARHHFLARAGTRKKRNMTEQLYRSVARSFLFAPDLLGPLAAKLPDATSAVSAAELLRLSTTMQSDLIDVMERAGNEGKKIATLSLQSDFAFSTAEQRADFAAALESAIRDVIARHTEPVGTPASNPFRLVIGCYPSVERSDPGSAPPAGPEPDSDPERTP